MHAMLGAAVAETRRSGFEGEEAVAADRQLVAVGEPAHSIISPLRDAVEAAVVEDPQRFGGSETISAWRRETLGSSRRMSAAALRPIRVQPCSIGKSWIAPSSSRQAR